MRAALRLLPLVGLLLAAGAAVAGPWPRAEGRTYVLLGHETGPWRPEPDPAAPPDEVVALLAPGWTSLYAERGGPRRLTFGVDAGARQSERLDGWDWADARLRAFVRVPLDDGEGAWRRAVEGGLGADLTPDGAVPRLHLGGSVGRGLEWRGRGGWAALEARGEFAADAPARWKLGLVAGLRPTPRDAVELALHAELVDGRAFGTVGPVWQRVLRDGVAGRVGVLLDQALAPRLALGLVREF